MADELLKGFDASVDCGACAREFADDGYSFVIRYYSHNRAKRLSFDEAHRLYAAGLKIATVWQDLNNSIEHFSRSAGIDDGTSAYNQALRLGQPESSAIYFAVDFDPTQAEISGAINDYFRGIAEGFSVIGHPSPLFSAGVYGSGLACAWLKSQGMVKYTWLSQSAGFRGSRHYQDWNIRQSLEQSKFGIKFDRDDAKPDFGGFELPVLVS